MTEQGGRCPSCGATYPRTIPADQDQRCHTCWLANEPTKPGGVMTQPYSAAVAAGREQAAAEACSMIALILKSLGGTQVTLTEQELTGDVPDLVRVDDPTSGAITYRIRPDEPNHAD